MGALKPASLPGLTQKAKSTRCGPTGVPILEPRAALGASSCSLYCQYMWRQLGVAWQWQRPAWQRCLYQSSFSWVSHCSTQTLGC